MYVEYTRKELEEKISQEVASFIGWCEDNLRMGLEDFIASQDNSRKETEIQWPQKN